MNQNAKSQFGEYSDSGNRGGEQLRDNWRLNTRHLGCQVIGYTSLLSTNDIALQHPVGTVILADEQTAGRGQFGRSWHSPPRSSVLLSVTLEPPPELRRPVILTAWAAVAVAEIVRQVTGEMPRIKWPNDVLLAGKKIAGILIEQKSVVVVGIGLNVKQSPEQFAAVGLPDAGSLTSITGRSFDRDEVARQLILQLDAEYAALLEGRISDLESRWVQFIGQGETSVCVERIDGSQVKGVLRELTFERVVMESTCGSTVSWPPESVRRIQ